MINLVADKEICQEAFKKGIKIESELMWNEDLSTKFPVKNEKTADWITKPSYPAPITDEILKELPEKIEAGIEHVTYYLEIFKRKDDYLAHYRSKNGVVFTFNIDKKLSNALLMLYTKLKDEGII
jgi:hypothetical protein